MDPREIKQYLEIASVVIGILATLGFFKWFWPAIRAGAKTAGDVFRAIAKLPEMHMQIGVVAREVQTNGGGSLKDAVLDGRHRLILMEATVRARADSDPNTAMFECGPEGGNTFVSETYCRWLGVGRDELMGWNYLTFVHEDDRDGLRDEWESCRNERRVYQRRHKMVSVTGEVIEVEAVVRPIPESGPIHRWIGVMRRI